MLSLRKHEATVENKELQQKNSKNDLKKRRNITNLAINFVDIIFSSVISDHST